MYMAVECTLFSASIWVSDQGSKQAILPALDVCGIAKKALPTNGCSCLNATNKTWHFNYKSYKIKLVCSKNYATVSLYTLQITTLIYTIAAAVTSHMQWHCKMSVLMLLINEMNHYLHHPLLTFPGLHLWPKPEKNYRQ